MRKSNHSYLEVINLVVVIVVLKIGKRLLEALEEMFFMFELHIEFSNVLSLSDFYYCKDQFRVYDFLKLCSSPCVTGNSMGLIFDLRI